MDGKGNPYINFAHQLQCRSCKQAKGIAFLAKELGTTAPSVSRGVLVGGGRSPWELAKLDKELKAAERARKNEADLKRVIADLRGQLGAAKQGGAGGASPGADASAGRAQAF